ncbi:RNA-directed DNA polymerase, eukaryota, reverse transcriptase zinc-binding domain protein [Tanacetum coccineum]
MGAGKCKAISRSGGLVCVWDPNSFSKLNVFPSDNILIVEGNWISTHMHCYMVNVYAPQDDMKKEILWKHILDFKEGNPGHYIIFGDFNVVRFASERIGTIFNSTSANVFNQFISDGHLWEIPHGGHLFTRINRRGDKLSKLDRFLITKNSTSHMHNYSAQVLDCHISDHRPIILSASTIDFSPSPFKLYNSWLLDKHLCTIVIDFWKHHVAEYGSNSIVGFKNKIKTLKTIIKEWYRNRTSSQAREKKVLLNKIKEFDAATVRGSGNITSDSHQSLCLGILCNIELEENLDTSQKAKVKWGIEADENSKFFHAIVNQKRRTLSIHGIKHKGQWLTDPHRIKDAFHSFFDAKFKKGDVTKIVDRSPFYNTLLEDQNAFLVSSVSEAEIRDAIWDCGSEKSSGPNGFTFAFYKKFRDTIKNDVTAFIQEFFKTSIIPKGCNTSFIALIPKISNPMVVSDFRPISLIGAQYKIIAKVMANRLAQVIDSVISREQSAFIKHRQILDGPPMVNEVMYFMGFSEKWISWTKGCLYSATALVLVNGSPTHEYHINCGLRQGDPLSPFLFIIAMEGLHVAVENVISAGLYRGIKFLLKRLSIFLRLPDATQSNPPLYLGLPVDCNMANITSWDPILDKFNKRLSKWKSSLLSIGGRTTLLSSVLGAIGSDVNGKKIPWISWRLVLASKDKGGLAIHDEHGDDSSFYNHVRNQGVWGRIVRSINSMHEKGLVPLSFLQRRVVNAGIMVEIYLGLARLRVE